MSNQNSNASNAYNNDAFANMFKDFKMPKIDFEAAMNTHRKNLETLTNAQNSWVNCAKNLSEANTNFMKQSFETMKDHWQEMMSSKSLEDKVQAHTTRLKSFFENSLNHGRSVGEQLIKSQQDISATVQNRFSEGTREAQDFAKKAAPVGK